ncbi:MAG: WD40 repeat domain-containing protein [Dehalococcoidia bacterium]|nr:WD40 repeat domain-containing protein [Dehalococcoidia bacterium]
MPLFGRKAKSDGSIWDYKTDRQVYSFGFSHDELSIAAIAGGDPGMAYLFSHSDGLLYTHDAPDAFYDISVAPDGSYLAIGGYDGNVYSLSRSGGARWKYQTGKPVRRVCIYSPDSRIVAGTDGAGVFAFEQSGKLLWHFEAGGGCTQICASQDGSVIAILVGAKTYVLSALGELLWDYQPTNGKASHISLSQDGSLLAVGWSLESPVGRPRPGRACLFDRSGKPLWQYEFDEPVFGICLASGGSVVTVSTFDQNNTGKLHVFDPAGKREWVKSGKNGYLVRTVSVAADGSLIAMSADKLFVFNRAGDAVWERNIAGGVTDARISQSGKLLVAGSGERVFLFDMDKVKV